jgi:hypothetical protein
MSFGRVDVNEGLPVRLFKLRSSSKLLCAAIDLSRIYPLLVVTRFVY